MSQYVEQVFPTISDVSASDGVVTRDWVDKYLYLTISATATVEIQGYVDGGWRTLASETTTGVYAIAQPVAQVRLNVTANTGNVDGVLASRHARGN